MCVCARARARSGSRSSPSCPSFRWPPTHARTRKHPPTHAAVHGCSGLLGDCSSGVVAGDQPCAAFADMRLLHIFSNRVGRCCLTGQPQKHPNLPPNPRLPISLFLPLPPSFTALPQRLPPSPSFRCPSLFLPLSHSLFLSLFLSLSLSRFFRSSLLSSPFPSPTLPPFLTLLSLMSLSVPLLLHLHFPLCLSLPLPLTLPFPPPPPPSPSASSVTFVQSYLPPFSLL